MLQIHIELTAQCVMMKPILGGKKVTNHEAQLIMPCCSMWFGNHFPFDSSLHFCGHDSLDGHIFVELFLGPPLHLHSLGLPPTTTVGYGHC